jgi:hypothetical protein
MAHTPGPWSIITEDHDISVDGEGWFDDQHVNGWMIVGQIDSPDMAIAVLDTGYKNNWNDTTLDANAALIAAAPDQNAALNNAVEFLHFYFVGPDAAKHRAVEGEVNMLAEAQKAFEVATAALARAQSPAPLQQGVST